MKKITKFLSLGLCCCAAACSNPSQKASDPDFTDSVSEALAAGGRINFANLEWTREPASYTVEEDKITITTAPHTDLWQRTYYHFRNDNAPVFQMQTKEQYFSFTVKTDFTQSHHRFDQCGIVMYLDSDNWLKGSVEYENEDFQHLGSVGSTLGIQTGSQGIIRNSQNLGGQQSGIHASIDGYGSNRNTGGHHNGGKECVNAV